MKKLFTLLFLITAAALAGSPYYTAYQLKTAYDNSDGDALVSHMDFDKLQPSIKTQLSGRFSNTLSQYPMIKTLGGTALKQTADRFVSATINKAITADNISQLISTQGQANAATKELAAVWAIASNKVNLQNLIQDMMVQHGDIDTVVKNQINIMMEKQATELAIQAQTGEDSDTPELKYCGINCFEISGKVKGYPITINMQRKGLIGWKIVDIKLP